jgi:hypothetical protein
MIYVNNNNNQLNITYDTRKDVYAFDSIKSVSFSWDTNGDYYIIINFIANDKNNSLRIYLKDVDPTLLWVNDFNGATLAVNTIALWMDEVITVNASIVSPIGQTTMSNSVAVVIASNQTGVPVTDNGGSLTVDATSLPLPTGAATETTLAAVKTSVQLIDDCVGIDNTAAPTKSFVVAGVTSGGIQQTIEVNTSGHVNIADGAGSITVDSNAAVRTPTILRTSASSSVAAGAYSVSFASVGTVDSTVGGATLKPGETINFDAGAINNTLGAITYNSSTAGAELLIITLT